MESQTKTGKVYLQPYKAGKVSMLTFWAILLFLLFRCQLSVPSVSISEPWTCYEVDNTTCFFTLLKNWLCAKMTNIIISALYKCCQKTLCYINSVVYCQFMFYIFRVRCKVLSGPVLFSFHVEFSSCLVEKHFQPFFVLLKWNSGAGIQSTSWNRTVSALHIPVQHWQIAHTPVVSQQWIFNWITTITPT